jgi:hypothetical protein
VVDVLIEGNVRHLSPIYVVGSNSAVANVVKQYLARGLVPFQDISLRWLASLEHQQFSAFWREVCAKDPNVRIFWCSALIDPNSEIKLLDRINYELPTAAFKILEQEGSLDFAMTLGTVLEGRGLLNPYVVSKEALASWSRLNMAPEKYVHIRTHTLVGPALPPKHMFLGQLMMSVRAGSDFTLNTNGLQMREFLSLEMFATYLARELSSSTRNNTGSVTIGGSGAVTLKQIAEQVLRDVSSPLHVQCAELGNLHGEIYQDSLITNDVQLAFPAARSLISTEMRKWLGKL